MKKWLFFMAAFLVAVSCGENPLPDPDPQPDIPSFVKGADISWASEMEEGSAKRTFQTRDGAKAPLLDALKDCGINAIRLRVWVNPYKGWSGKEDVLKMAKKVKEAGLALMIDFHYSDFFADPGRQLIPAAWKADQGDLNKMCQHVADHTTEVLKALKDAGVDVKWIQVGNETRNSLLSPLGDAVWKDGQIDLTNLVKLYNAGYDAAKAVYPNALVMPHLDNAYLSASYGNPMWLSDFKAKGGKFDMIAFSHYPQNESKIWEDGVEKTLTPEKVNEYAVNYIKKAAEVFRVPIMVSEVGVKTAVNEAKAKELLTWFVAELKKIDLCAGVFYWEPEADGTWRPEIYTNLPELSKYSGSEQKHAWGAYNSGAFTTDGKPTSVMEVFVE